MTRFEEGIVTALRERAEGEVDVRGLLDGATARGVRRQRMRRRMRAAGGGLVALAVAGGLLMASTRWEGARGPGLSAAGTPSIAGATNPSPTPTAFADLPRPPVVGHTATDPAVLLAKTIGRDHGAFHLDFVGVPGPVTQAQWSSFEGWERLVVEAGRYEITAEAGDPKDLDGPLATTTPVRVGGVPGLLSQADGMAQVRWQPVTGLWAQVTVNGNAALAQQLATALRMDRAFRCGVPFRLPGLAKNAGIQGCGLTVNPVGSESTVTVGTSWWAVTVVLSPTQFTPSTTVGGFGADVSEHAGDGGRQILEIELAVGAGETASFTAEGKYTRQEVLAMAAGYQQVAPYDQPAVWPQWANEGAPGGPPSPTASAPR